MGVGEYIKILKRYIRDGEYRESINTKIGFYNHLSDEKFMRRKFIKKMGKPLNLDNPKTFNEKLQWLKLYDRKPEYTNLVDKYEVKRIIKEKLGEKYVIPTLGVWNSFEEIDFKSLPNQFVLKCTHDSGGLVVCRDKPKLDIPSAKRKIERAMKRNYYWIGREWPYKNVRPRIIAEQYMEDGNQTLGLTDYKFFCFNNEVKMLYVSQGLENHATACISFFDLDGNEMPFHRKDYKPYAEKMSLPVNFKDMLKTAQELANEVDSPFVRIDLYSIEGETKFSEITFSPCNGMIPFEPEEWDRTIGDWLQLPADKE